MNSSRLQTKSPHTSLRGLGVGQAALILRRSLVAVLLSAFAVTGYAEDGLESDAGKFAVHVLKVYATKDVKKLLSLSNSGAPPETVLQEFAPGTPRHKSLFSDASWRWTAVNGWDGKLGRIRYERTAMVEFAQPSATGERAVLGLEYIGGKWRFDGIYRWPQGRFAKLGFSKTSLADFQEQELSDPTATSNAVLKAYQQKDVATVLKLSVDEGPMALLYLSEEEQQLPKADILFAAEEMQGVNTWNGKLGTVYLRQTAMVEFGRSRDEVFVVTMQQYGGEWKFEDIHSPSVADFDGTGKD